MPSRGLGLTQGGYVESVGLVVAGTVFFGVCDGEARDSPCGVARQLGPRDGEKQTLYQCTWIYVIVIG